MSQKNIIKFSGYLAAKLFGVISPNTSTITVKSIVTKAIGTVLTVCEKNIAHTVESVILKTLFNIRVTDNIFC